MELQPSDCIPTGHGTQLHLCGDADVSKLPVTQQYSMHNHTQCMTLKSKQASGGDAQELKVPHVIAHEDFCIGQDSDIGDLETGWDWQGVCVFSF